MSSTTNINKVESTSLGVGSKNISTFENIWENWEYGRGTEIDMYHDDANIFFTQARGYYWMWVSVIYE